MMKRRLFSFLLSITMLLSLGQSGVYAAGNEEVFGKVEIISASDITEGTYVIFGISSQITDNGGSTAFMSAEGATKSRLMSSQLSIQDGKVITDDSYSIWNLVQADGGFYIQNVKTETYLYYGNGSGNSIYQTKDVTAAGVWTVVAHNYGWTLQEVASGRQLSCNRFGSKGEYYLGFAAYELDSTTERILEFYKLGYSENSQPEHKHSYSGSVTDPTCVENGYTTYTCACGDTYQDNFVPAYGHDEVIDRGYAATCTESGLTDGVHCGNCNATLEEQKEIPALGHTWDNGVVTKEPTASEDGVRTFTCKVCSETKIEKIPYIPPIQADVQRLSGAGRVETSIEVAEELKEVLGIKKFDAVILANGDAFADALAGSYLASKKNAPILLHRNSGKGDELNEGYIRENLVAGGTVYLLGGTAAIPESLEDNIVAQGYTVIRLAGANRFDTNLKILEAANISASEEILITTGWEFADCLSASATGKPILMLNTIKGELTTEQITFLRLYADNDFTIIGGNAAVSADLEAQIEALVEDDVSRISGDTREKTSTKIAEAYFGQQESVLVAYSRNFPDGLCGGPLAYAMNAPLLLVNAGKEADAAAYVEKNNIEKGLVLGGTAAVSDVSVNIIFAE